MKQLFGNTYPHKDTIKSMGGRWDKDKKCWNVPDEVWEELSALCKGEDKAKVEIGEGIYES